MAEGTTTVTPGLRALTPEEAARAAALLDEALDLPAAERCTWLQALPAREPALAAVVAGLLAAVGTPQAGDRPETGVLIARRLAERAPASAPSLEGRLIGPYRVRGLLGQGGMGSVWRAGRADGLFEREVALKLVHPALVGPALLERFARERRILAGLAHPHIARLLDAGVSDNGQPYLALELVDGTPLDQYCSGRRLPLAGRLALMLQVLAAVQHAHQNLVIHRDLKPANILVGDDGHVHLLDFGIAKLMQDGAADETELTRVGGRALTPQYASPEQLAGQTVGTASDVYSLGVVLYELLCGQTPQHGDTRRPSQQPISLQAAGERHATPRALALALAGDLDTIALKALRPDPADRYPTAEALRQDLQRHLAGEPVLARPDSAAYRLRKFVRRHRTAVTLAASVSALLVAAAAVSLWQADGARKAAAEAERQSQRAQAVQRFLLEVFGANTLRQQDPLRARQTTARELLDAGAERASRSLAASPQAQEAVLDTLADLYFQLELPEQAARLRRERIGALERAYGAYDPRVAEAWLSYAIDVADADRHAEAAEAAARARTLVDAIGEPAAESRGWVELLQARLAQYTDIPAMRRHADAALAQFRARPLRWTNLYHALQAAARARHRGGEHEAAVALHAEAAALAQANEPSAPIWLITPYVQEAEATLELGRVDRAEALLREALAIARRVGGEAAAATLQTQIKLGALLHAGGRRDEGWALLQDAERRMADPAIRASPDARSTLRRFLGAAALERGDAARAHALLAAEVADLRAHYPASVLLARELLPLANALGALGRRAEAEAALDEAERLLPITGATAPAHLRRLQAARARLRG